MALEGNEKKIKTSRWSDLKWIKRLFSVFVFVLVFLFAGFLGNEVTSSSQFCSSCHEMAPEHYTWKASSHAGVDCVECHTGTSLADMAKAKGNIVVQAYRKITNSYEPPIKMPKQIDDKACTRCHNMSTRKTSPSGDLIIPHDLHTQKQVKCVSCHAGVAHGLVSTRNITYDADYDKWNQKMGNKAMAETFYVRPQMKACMDCHEARKVTVACIACHTTGELPENHTQADFISKVHGPEAKQDLAYCDSCHKWMTKKESKLFKPENSYTRFLKNEETETPKVSAVDYASENDSCRNCHSKKPKSHGSGFMAKHGIEAKKDEEKCLVCHSYAASSKKQITTTTCGSCHPSAHADFNLTTEHPRTDTPATKLTESCYDCHDKVRCQTCHRPSE